MTEQGGSPVPHYDSLSAPVSRDELRAFKRTSTAGLSVTAISTCVALGLIALIFFVIFIPQIFTSSDLSGSILMVVFGLLIMAGIAVAVRYVIRRTVERSVRAQRFAMQNGFVYRESVKDPSYPGMYFHVGAGTRLSDTVGGSDGEGSFEIGNVSYETGSGKNRRTVTMGYVMIGLERALPHMVLDGTANNMRVFGVNISNLPEDFRRNQKLSLEGDFDKYFTLYVPQGYERDALYVFTPDLMALFIDKASVYDAEIIDDKLFAYTSELCYDKPDVMRAIFDVIGKVGLKTIDRTDLYADARAVVPGMVADGGRRLKTGVSVVSVAIGFVIFLVYLPQAVELILEITRSFFGK